MVAEVARGVRHPSGAVEVVALAAAREVRGMHLRQEALAAGWAQQAQMA